MSEQLSDQQIVEKLAGHVMGWARCSFSDKIWIKQGGMPQEVVEGYDSAWWPLTSWADCGEVIDRIRAMEWVVTMEAGNVDAQCWLEFTMPGGRSSVEISEVGGTPQRAVCLAAVAAYQAREGE